MKRERDKLIEMIDTLLTDADNDGRGMAFRCVVADHGSGVRSGTEIIQIMIEPRKEYKTGILVVEGGQIKVKTVNQPNRPGT